MQGDLAAVRGVTVFKQIDALPCAQNRPTVCDRDGQRHIGQRSPDVGGHIVGAFGGVAIEARVFLDQSCKEGFKIQNHIGIGVFLYRQAGGCVAAL